VFADIAQRVFISLVVFIALPALLMTILFTSDPRRTLLLHKWPSLASIPVALLLAAAFHPLVHSMSFVVQRLYPMSDAMKANGQVLQGLFENAPYAWLPFLLIAVLPALCEEVAFRGFILSGLRHIGHKWWAICLSAIFFGIAHGVLQQSIMASMLGVLLGYIAVQTGSLLPCIFYHMAHNGLALLSTRLPEYFTPEAYEQFPQLTLLVQREIDKSGAAEYSYGWPLVIAGAAIGGYLLTWLYRLPYAKTAEEQLQDALEHQNAGTMVSAGE
jgi:sodium transport system permease protein